MSWGAVQLAGIGKREPSAVTTATKVVAAVREEAGVGVGIADCNGEAAVGGVDNKATVPAYSISCSSSQLQRHCIRRGVECVLKIPTRLSSTKVFGMCGRAPASVADS